MYVKANHNVFSFFEIGVLLSAYKVVFLFAAPFVGKNLSRVGRKKMILIGVAVLAGSVALFAVATLFKNDYVFYAISLVARLSHGTADGILTTSIFSIAMIEYPRQAELY